MAAEIPNAFLGDMQQLQAALAGLRAESRQVRIAFSAMSDSFSRQARHNSEIEHRISELRDDMEAMLKLEIGGALANFETRLEERFHALETRLDDKLGGMDQKLDQLLDRPKT